MGSNYLVQDLAIIGIAAMVVTWLFSILKMPMLLGYILAGVLVSPVLGLIHESADIAQMGEIGVMFMMFFIGMEFNFERLKEVAAVSVLGIVAQALVLVLSGLAMAAFLGLSATNGVFLGAILSMSSTIVLVDLLAQRRELSKPFAQIAVGILILEDLFAIMLIVALSTVGDGIRLDISGIATRCLTMSAFVVSIFVAGKLCAPWVIRKIALPRSPQVLTMFVFCFILALGELASAVDLSTSLGAFLAGSILSGTAISARIENITNPFRNLFVALFFVSVGTMASPAKIAGALPAIVAMSLLVIVLKVAACWIGTVAGGANPRDAYLASVNKAQVGEFGLVIAGIGINRGVLDSSVFAIVMGVSFITILLNPFLSALAGKTADAISQKIPTGLMDWFQTYERLAKLVSAAVCRTSYVMRISAPAVKLMVYFLLLNGAMLAAVLISGVLSYLPSAGGFSFGGAGFAIVGLASVVLLLGFVRSAGSFAWAAVDAVPIFASPGLQLLGARLALFARIAFYAVSSGLAAFIYFAAFSYCFGAHVTAVWTFFAAFGAALVFRRAIFAFNKRLEDSFMRIFRRHIKNSEPIRADKLMERVGGEYSWTSELLEVEIPELSSAAGKSVRELAVRSRSGSEIIAIKRGRFTIYEILPQTRIFPDDIVILGGTSDSNRKAEAILTEAITDFDSISEDGDVSVERFTVGEGSKLEDIALMDADLPRMYGVRIAGIIRCGESKIDHPKASDILRLNDMIIVAGTSENIGLFAEKNGLVRR